MSADVEVRKFDHETLVDLRLVVREAINSARAKVEGLEGEDPAPWASPELLAQMLEDARAEEARLVLLRRAVR